MFTANSKLLLQILLRTLTAATVLSLAACATTQPQTGPVSAAPEQAEEVEIVDNFEGDGMEIPLNGSSVAEFESSLAMVKRHTTQKKYELLEGAIEYLLIYDLGAERSMEKLAARLDGLNGYEIVDKTKAWRKMPSPTIRPQTPPPVTTI